MKKAIHFFEQMTFLEQTEFKTEFKTQNAHLLLSEWLEEKEFLNFEQFLYKAFDHDKTIKGRDQTQYRFWFDVMLKYTISSPIKFD